MRLAENGESVATAKVKVSPPFLHPESCSVATLTETPNMSRINSTIPQYELLHISVRLKASCCSHCLVTDACVSSTTPGVEVVITSFFLKDNVTYHFYDIIT